MKRKRIAKKKKGWISQLNGVLAVLIVIAGLYIIFQLFNSYIYTSKQGESGLSSTGQCLEEGKRYAIDEAANNPGMCDIEISTDEDFAKISTLSYQLKNVQTLYLRKTPNTELPPNISDLENLRSLNFHHTFNTSLPPEIGELKNLKVIHMSKTDINYIPPEIGELSNLENLSIVNNAARVTLPAEIGKLEKLKTLALSGSPEIFLPEELANLQSLEELYLDDTKLNTIPEQILNLKNLTFLNLSYNYLAASDIERVRQSLPSTTVVFQN